MNVAPNFTPIIAALCRMYGKSGNGGYEIYIPADILGNLSPTGVIDQLPNNPAEPGARFRYRPNRVIEGELVTTASPPLEEELPHLPEPQ